MGQTNGKAKLDLLGIKLMLSSPEEVQATVAASVYEGSDTGIVAGNIARANPKDIEVVNSRSFTKKMMRKEVVGQLQASGEIINELNETWESKLKKTDEI